MKHGVPGSRRMSRQRIILQEWLFTISGPVPGHRGHVRTVIENADGADRQFGRALALLIQAWWQARGGRP